jgi:hypothetical protein
MPAGAETAGAGLGMGDGEALGRAGDPGTEGDDATAEIEPGTCVTPGPGLPVSGAEPQAATASPRMATSTVAAARPRGAGHRRLVDRHAMRAPYSMASSKNTGIRRSVLAWYFA